MSNPQATNAVVQSAVGKKHFIFCDKNGVPLDGQVAKSISYYVGDGNETVTIQGTDSMIVQSTLADGDLNITPSVQDLRNLDRRIVHVVIPQGILNDVVFTLPAGYTFTAESAAYDTLNTFTHTAAGGLSFCKTLVFDTINNRVVIV